MCVEEVNTDFNRIVSDRLTKDDELFFVNASGIYSKFGMTVIEKKSFQGVMQNDTVVIRPIYDGVDVISRNMAAVRLLNRLAVFSLPDGEQLSEFEYVSVAISDDVMVLHGIDGETALYNLRTSKFLHRGGRYQEFNLKDSSTEYIWARRNRFYDYICRSTGRVVPLPGIIMAYDTEYGIFGLNEHKKVYKFDEHGVVDSIGLRELVIKEGGYLSLHNYTYNIEHIIDIYGNMLNI